jgi:hypothetical protein
MSFRPAITTINLIIGTMVVLAVIAAAMAVLRMDPWGQRESGPLVEEIDPALIQYEQSREIPIAMREVRALAVGPDERIYVGGDQAIHVLKPDGTKAAEIPLGGQPRCLAVGSPEHAFPGRLYVGMKDHVEVFDAGGAPLGAWQSLGEKALLTSLAAAEHDVFAADAGNRIVWHYDAAGELQGRIGAPDKARKIPGFLITSPYFDLALGRDGLLYVVNPRALRIEAFTFQGDLEFSWGKSSPQIEGFFGCCNPAHFAVLSDGSFVTAEKGMPRVKIYSPQGKFECVVAGGQQMSVTAADVAADRRDRVLILDPLAVSLRIFERKQTGTGAEQ